ncbi:MAG TPA: flagellar basal body P-ring formation chaperone FlgA [Bryobacteraceae bacterium]|jgi:flagella basal body P-ring formation protein FlgA|nr:flagellar basal body P-ring formation chaperone FlgA [Bryobacteraceae bacterium]
MISLASVALAGCLAVSAGSDHITLRDLAPAFPGLAGATPDEPVGLAPAPGVQRVLRLPELRRLAARLRITADPKSELCFERPVAPLDPARLLEAMRKQLPEAQIEILEYSRLSVPEGELEFPLNGLRQLPTGGFWSGSVRYAGGHRSAVWARVKVMVIAPRVISAEDLKPGCVIDASQVRVEMREDFPAVNVFVTALEQAVGRVLERPVRSGTALRSQWLEMPKDVLRGDTVQVEVWSGGAHLRLPAVAEASGSAGQSIAVRNLESKKRFWATVVGKGRVSVGKEGL